MKEKRKNNYCETKKREQIIVKYLDTSIMANNGLWNNAEKDEIMKTMKPMKYNGKIQMMNYTMNWGSENNKLWCMKWNRKTENIIYYEIKPSTINWQTTK